MFGPASIGRRSFRASVAALVFVAASGAAQAAIITSVTAPKTMTRPDDGKTYIFTVDVTLTAQAGDKPGDQIECDFQTVGGQTIDIINIEFPLNKKIIVGGNYNVGFSMMVGCQPLGANMEIFGPQGVTAMATITGDFLFATGQVFGTNTVTCTNPIIQPNPTNTPPVGLPLIPPPPPPMPPPPVVPAPVDFLSAVPEPNSFVQATLGILGVGCGWLGRKMQIGQNSGTVAASRQLLTPSLPVPQATTT
jgi:hypothetical protein